MTQDMTECQSTVIDTTDPTLIVIKVTDLNGTGYHVVDRSEWVKCCAVLYHSDSIQAVEYYLNQQGDTLVATSPYLNA